MKYRAWFGVALFVAAIITSIILRSWDATWSQIIGGSGLLVFAWLESKTTDAHFSAPELMPDAVFIASLLSCVWIFFGAGVEAQLSPDGHPRWFDAILLAMAALWFPILIARMINRFRDRKQS